VLINEARCVVNFVMDHKIEIFLAGMLSNLRKAEFLGCAHVGGCCGCNDSCFWGRWPLYLLSLRLEIDSGYGDGAAEAGIVRGWEEEMLLVETIGC
jgi:hypothetical protein